MGGGLNVLAFHEVVKTFGAFAAVDGLSFSVPEGQVFGFLGANGAGKTTSLRMALDILRPTSGTIEVLGARPGRKNADKVGFLPEERGLYRGMTCLDVVVYFGRLKGMSQGDAKARAQLLLDRFGLGGWMRKSVQKLSKGMAQKVQLAAALVNSPTLLILDEPFSGLDPVNQRMLEETILEMARSGSTVVFSTHVMQHAERLSDRLLMLAHGKKVFEGSQQDAQRRLPGRVLLTAKGEPKGLPGVQSFMATSATDDWTDWDVALVPGAEPGDLLQACIERGFALRNFEIRRASLHDVFIALIGGPVEEAVA
jgi:ABC-2 type transport system ATP-binding protein